MTNTRAELAAERVGLVARAIEREAEECGFSIFSGDAESIARAVLSALRGQGEGWQAIDENTPVACHVLAARFDPSFGEWVLGFVASPPTKPFTHWRFVAPPSQTGGDK